ncbi:MAG TPA: YIP1 family protein [Paracoccaceae bacterium]|nr:YIP1 family protein [Paracoccaceae bacterium]
MSVVGEVLATWRDPAGPVGRLLSAGPREDRSLVIVIAASVLMFVARTPELARKAALSPEVPLEASLGINLFVMMFILPLLAYGLAFVSHLALRAFGRDGAPFGARVALFWAMLAIVPGMLVQGLTAGLVGPDSGMAKLIGLVVFVVFLWFWGRGLMAAYPVERAAR